MVLYVDLSRAIWKGSGTPQHSTASKIGLTLPSFFRIYSSFCSTEGGCWGDRIPGTAGFLYAGSFVTLIWMPHIVKRCRGFQENRKVPGTHSNYSYIMNWFQIIFHKIVYHLAKFGIEAQCTSWNICKSIFHYFA